MILRNKKNSSFKKILPALIWQTTSLHHVGRSLYKYTYTYLHTDIYMLMCKTTQIFLYWTDFACLWKNTSEVEAKLSLSTVILKIQFSWRVSKEEKIADSYKIQKKNSMEKY